MRFFLGGLFFVLVIAAAALAECQKTSDERPSIVGCEIADFSLRDPRGREGSLAAAFTPADGENSTPPKFVVVAFVGCECPLARQYAPRLAKLAEEYQPRGVAFLAIDSNQQDTLAELADFARTYEIKFPLLKDPGNVVADRFAAARTPEVFLLDDQRIVRYRGRIDDQFIVGRQRPQATRRDLAIALEELLSGQPVSVTETDVQGCRIGRLQKREAAGEVTYSNQIARLLDRRCVECHRPGEVAPFALTSYDEAVGWAESMREVIEQGRMPPWFANPEFGKFHNDPRLSEEEKRLLADWVDAGCPEGDRSQLPEPRQFTAGWQIPPPDQVVYIRDEPVDVPAEGVVKYQYYTVDPGFTADTWIKAAECRPDNRAVVHHIVAFFVPPGEKPRGRRGAMVGFAPGMPPTIFPEGAAMLVPAGSKIVFQLHYTPNGSPQKDRSSLGLVFADPAEVREKIGGGMAANPLLQIPPGDENHEVHSQHRFDNDVRLLTLTPHMHLRGKSFRYEADYPDGRSEILLEIPRYDFNWQLRYHLAEPKLLPKGTLLRCTAHFDNSAGNVANPDPTKTVRWGDQTWEEMMIGYFTTLPAGEPATR
ncbi:MAG TPA: redoxin domain-containing protein [Pirellulales bacterium]|nr:redoxin domain-containing protein [Pirellulales bacterium]